EALVKEKAMGTSKLSVLMSDYRSTMYFVPPVFRPFVETCKTCHREIGSLEDFVVIGATRCTIKFDPDLNRDLCNILQHVPIFVYCQNCGDGVYGDKLREALQW
ncbi:hypothetical protein, partial [Geobacter sp. OR-1]|uniref:hypothetical protein n=1 Tax=Geobacter sp. OR-1 TaxID=1266765 RepID=UPI0005AB3E42